MNRALLPVLLLFLALLPPIGAAQAPVVQVLQDAAGDVRSDVQGTAGPSATVLYPGLDLLGLAVEESKPAFAFTLQLAAAPSAQDPGFDGAIYEIHFAHNGRQFRIVAVDALPGLQAISPQPVFADLDFRDTTDAAWSRLWTRQDAVSLDPGAKTLRVTVDRRDLLDADGAWPFPGRLLDDVWAQSRAVLNDAGFLNGMKLPLPERFLDDMPEAGAAHGQVPVVLGPAQTGHARLTSRQPFRASNGEATTYVLQATAHNLADSEDRFELSVSDTPHGYTLVLPDPVITIPAKSSVDVPVLLTMPFGHQHGSSSSFLLEMRSLSDDGSVGRLEMGVSFLAVPQPAGHHDTVYLHSNPMAGGLAGEFGYRSGYMNTLEDDKGDTGKPLYSSSLNVRADGSLSTQWIFPLNPALAMGLDVDRSKVGQLAIPISTTAPMQHTILTATLLAAPGVDYPQDGGTLLATAGPSDPVDIGPKSQAVLHAALVPDAKAAPLPYEPQVNLWLRIEVSSTGPGLTWSLTDEGAGLGPGAFAVLPLSEWHDAVDDALAVQGGPLLAPLGPQERLVNPGKGAAFPVSIANTLGQEAHFELQVTGPNAEWASWPATVHVPAHGTAQATVVVKAPAGAVDQERADLVLQAYSKDHPDARGLLRLVTEVDSDAQHPDDLADASTSSAKKSPGLEGATVLLGLAALALMGRRRTG